MSGDSRDPYDPSEDAVIPPPPPATAVPDATIPPPPPESSVPDVVIPPPPPESSVPDVVIPPPPPEAMLPATRRSRPKPAILEGDQPAPVADDWAQPSVAPEVPTSGGYRALTFVIFAFLLLLLAAAIVGAIYLGVTTLGLSAVDSFSVAGAVASWTG
ncbi:hypothetical protein [Microbacterium phyllosphaerae]|uniref:hypothetical protein n=1 Tax=Microbacterium phyllosphaerae TaxID=124798 RepID=UPI0021685A38|nr:hypothetical protein [Microbacterium phyllosphaerae]MCS3443268.1 hypothetical protein [Microbacterium phyllosphaerae]